MTKILLTIVFIFACVISWLFSTSTTVGGKHNAKAFLIKSIFYWFTVIAAIGFGYLIATL